MGKGVALVLNLLAQDVCDLIGGDFVPPSLPGTDVAVPVWHARGTIDTLATSRCGYARLTVRYGIMAGSSSELGGEYDVAPVRVFHS